MRQFGLAVASLVLLSGTSAHAAVTLATVSGTVDGTVVVNDTTVSTTSATGSNVTAQSTGSVELTGGTYNSYLQTTPTTVSFLSSNASGGTGAFVDAGSIVDIGFTNTSGSAVTPTFVSTIVPAGFGFYLADASNGSCLYANCPAATGATFSDLLAQGGNGQRLATAEFNFQIFDGDNPNAVYTASGMLDLMYNANGGTIHADFNDSALALTGFRSLDYGAGDPPAQVGDNYAYGYSWDATSIVLPLSQLGSGQTRTLHYVTSVRTTNTVGCTISPTLCLIAYAGFGDPIGAGGDANFDFAAASLFSASGDLSFSLLSAPLLTTGDIENLMFQGATFNRPTFDDVTGQLTFQLVGGGGTNAIPEPATWLTMIMGFGFLGAVMRRRRGLAAA